MPCAAADDDGDNDGYEVETYAPTVAPTTSDPTTSPSISPTTSPTISPTTSPSNKPTYAGMLEVTHGHRYCRVTPDGLCVNHTSDDGISTSNGNGTCMDLDTLVTQGHAR